MELKSYNSFNNLTQREELPYKHIQEPSEESPSPKREKIKTKSHKGSKVVIKRSEIQSNETDMHDPDHYKMLEEMYSQQYFQSLFQMSQAGMIQAAPFIAQPAYLPSYRHDSNPLGIKKEHEPLKSGMRVSTSPFHSKDFGLINPSNFKVEARSYGIEPAYEQCYQSERHDENTDTSTKFTKIETFRDRTFSESPLRKKVKFSDGISPNMLENYATKPNFKLTDK